ncbi:Dol-P-Man:Man(7)GlcNAc(2)-PP-Dol alpha-1,6-mannosyltransferase [Cryptotrichosporon argae]
MPLSRLLALTLFAVPAAHVLVAPYTKVEESFNLHAVHDVLKHGLDFAKWDHRTFPGAVPRSFLPPVLLGVLTYPFSVAGVSLGLIRTSVDVQITVRLVLAAAASLSLVHLTTTLAQRYGALTSNLFALLSLAQFHIPFYAGRTLPNSLALPGVIYAISLILRDESRRITASALALLTAIATVIRLELALFVLPLAAALLLFGRLTFTSTLVAGLAGGIGSLAISAPLDYFLWAPVLPHPSLPFKPAHALWPELSAARFNVVEGGADAWGRSPAHWYATRALPKLLAGAAPLLLLLPLAGVRKGRYAMGGSRAAGEVLRLLGPAVLGLIGGLSAVGHKEWRFIVYAVPVLNILAAAVAASLWSLPYKQLHLLARLGVVGLLCATAAITALSTYVSMHNYPGGQVWRILEAVSRPGPDLCDPGDQCQYDVLVHAIHYHNLPLQTGATLFTFTHAPSSSPAFPEPLEPAWEYSKTEDAALVDPAVAAEAFDVVVTELAWEGAGWERVGAVYGVEGMGRGGKWGIEVKWTTRLSVYRRL